jgi:hypothetical protein
VERKSVLGKHMQRSRGETVAPLVQRTERSMGRMTGGRGGRAGARDEMVELGHVGLLGSLGIHGHICVSCCPMDPRP